jgi:hypothetical protein
MLPEAIVFLNAVNLITGTGRGCGKTAFADAAALSLHNARERCARIAVGIEGTSELKFSKSADLRSGDIFLTSAAMIDAATCGPEIFDVVPGGSALGRLIIAKATRTGRAILVGPERNERLSWVIQRIITGGWTTTIIVDGALNRITQVAAIPSARLFYAAKASRSDFARVAERLRFFQTLTQLPLLVELERAHPGKVVRINGPLSVSTLENLPSGCDAVVVADFSKIFLDEKDFFSLARKIAIGLEKRIEFAGFAISLKNISKSDFQEALGEETREKVAMWNSDVCERCAVGV